MKPIAFVDIDGVLNRYLATEHQADEYGFFAAKAIAQGTEWPLALDRRDHGRLTSLEPEFELAWGTTWEDEAINVSRLIGFKEDFPIIARTRFREYDKAPGVIRAAEGRPFIWFDDMYGNDHMDFFRPEWETLHPQSRVIKINPRLGLQDEHIEQAFEWLNRLETNDD